jgi:transcriptional regulator with XRE-family HTH domain
MTVSVEVRNHHGLRLVPGRVESSRLKSAIRVARCTWVIAPELGAISREFGNWMCGARGRIDGPRVAGELGVSQGRLSRYEQGRSETGAEVLLRLSRSFTLHSPPFSNAPSSSSLAGALLCLPCLVNNGGVDSIGLFCRHPGVGKANLGGSAKPGIPLLRSTPCLDRLRL